MRTCIITDDRCPVADGTLPQAGSRAPLPAGDLRTHRSWSGWPTWALNRGLCWGCPLLLATGITLQATIRDTWGPPIAIVFYALPRPVLLGLALVSAWAWSRRLSPPVGWLRRSSRWGWLLTGTALAGWVIAEDVEWHPRLTAEQPGAPAASPSQAERPAHIKDDRRHSALPASRHSLRLVSWNVGRLPFGRAAVADWLRTQQADILALGETGPLEEPDLAAWQTVFPEYDLIPGVTDQLLLVRRMLAANDPTDRDRSAVVGSVTDIERIDGPHVLLLRCDITWRNAPLRVVLADVPGNVRLPRRPPMHDLTAAARRWNDRPLIVCGDFNTPENSAFLDELHTFLRPAFRERGRGYAPTWPVPGPVLWIDFVWVNAAVTVQAAEHGWTSLSDHRPVITDVTIPTIAPLPAIPKLTDKIGRQD